MSEKSFAVVGISDSANPEFPSEVRKIIAGSRIFSGGRRHHEIVRHLLPPDHLWIDIEAPLKKVWDNYGPHREILIFASGDPLFYGFATTLQREFPNSSITVYPAFNSLQILSHRMLIPYAGMVNVSVTGRPWDSLDAAVIEQQELIGVLTDRKKGPIEIASRLLEYGYDNYLMSVGENLGNEDLERIRTFPLEKVAEANFKHPNCVILQMTHKRHKVFGISEKDFFILNGREKMITKMPIRLLTLAMLDLHQRKTMWDIGFCTGSVSIEAKLRFPKLDIIAFERRIESRELLAKNCRKFGTPGIQGVIADFFECDLSNFRRPDAVFIGGHGGRLVEMIKSVATVLNPGGVIVFNSVSPESCRLFETGATLAGLSRIESHDLTIDNHNTIKIMKAQ